MINYILCDKNVNDSPISKSVLATYRYGNLITTLKIPLLKQALWFTYKILDLIIVKTIANADIPAESKIGKNLYLAHGTNGIVIHPKTVIGENVKIYHQVTLGSNGTGNNQAPIIGSNVFIGVGAKVLGRVTVGDNAKIGSNAVVLKDVPKNTTALGIPATLKNHA